MEKKGSEAWVCKDVVVEEAKKEVKASFKIEITNEERAARDKTVTNVYHTGISMSQRDLDELQTDNLERVQEESASDDPDEDLDF
jgi:hypothetical protein